MGCEAAGEANALFRSGPLRPAFEKEVLSSTFGFQACDLETQFVPSGYGRPQTYTGLPIQNRGRTTKSWTEWAEFRQIFQSRQLCIGYLASMPAGAFSCTMNWALASSAKRPPFATSSSKVPL